MWRRLGPTPRVVVFAGVSVAVVGLLSLLLSLSRWASVEVPAVGGQVREGVVGNPRFFNPLLATLPAERDITRLVFAGLTRLDASGEFVPDLAQEITRLPDDPTQYRVVLRENARFHDGTPLTSEDVVFTYRLAQDPAYAPTLAGGYSGIKLTAENERAVIFSFPQAAAHQALDLLQLGILPRHLWENTAPETFAAHPANLNPVGAGPFVFTGLMRDESGSIAQVSLRSWRDAPRQPKISSLQFLFFPTRAQLNDALAEGAIDATANLPLNTFLSLPSRVQQRYTLYQRPTNRVFALFYNQNQEAALKDVRARRALDLLIDRKQLIETVLKSEAWVTRGPLPPTEASRPPTVDAEQRAQAESLLQAAGWKQGEDEKWRFGKDTSEDFAIVIRTGTQQPLPRVAEFIANQWSLAGIPTRVETFDTGALAAEVLRPRLYEVLLFGMVISTEGDLYPFWHSSQRNDPGVNVAQYANIKVDEALEKARSATSTRERQAALDTVVTTLLEEVPASFLFTPLFTYFARTDVQGIVLPPVVSAPEDRFVGVGQWYRETDTLWKPVAALMGITR
ncbi:MAG: ABC transporter substrate-binding protein [Candidatus Parcubacteria bacterium]|nr:MAG: ABC transporter substrate-binding protein [Candidatus Parcubacteria bacterium]